MFYINEHLFMGKNEVFFGHCPLQCLSVTDIESKQYGVSIKRVTPCMGDTPCPMCKMKQD